MGLLWNAADLLSKMQLQSEAASGGSEAPVLSSTDSEELLRLLLGALQVPSCALYHNCPLPRETLLGYLQMLVCHACAELLWTPCCCVGLFVGAVRPVCCKICARRCGLGTGVEHRHEAGGAQQRGEDAVCCGGQPGHAAEPQRLGGVPLADAVPSAALRAPHRRHFLPRRGAALPLSPTRRQ